MQEFKNIKLKNILNKNSIYSYKVKLYLIEYVKEHKNIQSIKLIYCEIVYILISFDPL